MIYGYHASGGKAEVEYYDNGATTLTNVSAIVIPDTGWHHVAYQYDGTHWNYFLDGVKTVISASISATLPATAANLAVGNATAGGAHFVGNIARVLIVNSALTDLQIQTLAGRPVRAVELLHQQDTGCSGKQALTRRALRAAPPIRSR